MFVKDGTIVWSPRVPKADLLRLYENDANGTADEELLLGTGLALYMRCSDILYVLDILNGLVRCPVCEYKEGRKIKMNGINDLYTCPECAFSIGRKQLEQSYRHKQLNPGGAVPFFREFMQDWGQAESAPQKMLAIDKVIHSFHYSLKADPSLPTRAAGVNLIEGKIGDVTDFLDALSRGRDDAASCLFRQQLAEYRKLWNIRDP